MAKTLLLRMVLVCLVGLMLSTPGRTAGAEGEAPRRVKVLFLGDNGHHVPLERCRQVYSLMAQRGIDFVYSDNLADLNPKTLGHYDTLLLYANWISITPEQEKALIGYVEGGGGLAVIHCGSFCFLNSPRITAMVGGRFKSHSTGVFSETIDKPEHPIEKGLKPIESWDESYVHEMHNEKDRTVLSYRVEGDHREPYTWVRTQGKGRVFYTAWGHDERTWGNENFQNLLERGVRWSAGDWALAPEPKRTFSYVDASIPNYIPNAAWGTTGKPIGKMQEPIPPAESMKHLVLPPGFEARLVCSEPDIKKPICMAFDERGRLWVAETFDYPNNMQKAGEGHDRITICQSTKNNVVCDRFTVFADKLSIPTSMVFANGGLIVSQAPDMLFLKDTKGDDNADVRKVLFSGFGTHDTHAGPSNLHWGFDNWIYGTCGYSGFDGTVGGRHVSFGAGVFRFKPDGSAMEFLGSTNNNTWGLGLSEDNQIVGSTANGNPAWYVSIPGRYFEDLRGWPATKFDPIADTWKFFAVTSKVRQVDWWGGYTAGAGSELYTARSFPKSYWNRVAFVSEPTGHIVGQFRYQPVGSTFTARNEFNLLASDDEWTAPIAATVGPDGAVWVIDWYNFIVQHNPIPQGWVAGKGGAYETPLRDQRHGRVYRVSWKDGKPSQTFDLSKAGAEQLVAALHSDNLFWRLQAQRLLVEKGDKSVVPLLLPLVNDQSADEIGLNGAAIGALWALADLGSFDNADALAAAVKALKHPSAGVRKAALDVLPRDVGSLAAVLGGKLLKDADPQVRKAALLAIAQMPPSAEAGDAVHASLADARDKDDVSIAAAADVAACRHDAGFLRALFAAHPRSAGGEVGTVVAPVNLIPNPSFEEADAPRPMPKLWHVRTYSGTATHTLDSPGHTSAHAVRIDSAGGSDTSLFVDVPVEPFTDYRLSGWIRTQDLEKTTGMGALLNVHLTDARTPAVSGTSDWKKVEVTFNSGDRKTVSINCLFGGWGHAKGTAWFDDIELSPASGGSLPGREGKVAAVVIDQYARRGSADTVVGTLSALKNADPQLATLVVNGLAAGWPEGAAPRLADADVASLREVMGALPAGARDRLLALASRWNRPDVFAEQAAALTADLRTAIGDASLDASKRADAARRLVNVDDRPETVALLLKQVTPQAAPDVQTGIISALAESRGPATGAALLARWPELTPTAQKAALDLTLRRAAWTGALLDAIDKGAVNGHDLLPQQWQALSSNPDPAIAKRARALRKNAGQTPSADRAEIVKRLLPLANQHGDAARGKPVFEKNCMVCHTLDGKGGKVGPELTGVGARPRADVLMQILDPNRSVEGTYRQWIVKSKDDVISGRLSAESKASIEIIDAAGQTHVIPRDQIEVLKATDKGVMPEGLEALPEQDLVDLLEYLSLSNVKR